MASRADLPEAAPPAVAEGGEPRAIGRWGRFERRWLLTVGTVAALGATGIMLVEAFSRSFLDHSYFWAEEAVRYLMVWAFFLTLGAAGRAGTHIRTEMLVDALPPALRRGANVLSSLIGLGFCVLLFVAAIPQVWRYYTMGMMTESTLDLPMWAIFLGMPVGAALFALYYLECLVRALRGEDPFGPHSEPKEAAR